MTQTKAEQQGSNCSPIKRYPNNITPRPLAEQYAEQIEYSLPSMGLSVSATLWAAELRRLSPMEAAWEQTLQLLSDKHREVDKAKARIKELEDALSEVWDSSCTNFTGTPSNKAFSMLNKALKPSGEKK